MGKIEFTKDSFDMGSFLEASRRYLQDPENIPVLVAESCPKFGHNQGTVEVFFYDSLLRTICRGRTRYQRDLNDILTYGYIGNSRGGKNGLVVIPPRDRNLQGVVERFCSPRYSEFCNLVEFPQNDPNNTGVKVVTHRKSGERIIGVFNRDKRSAVLYGTRRYSP